MFFYVGFSIEETSSDLCGKNIEMLSIPSTSHGISNSSDISISTESVYDDSEDNEEETDSFNIQKLFSFAWQIAKGMVRRLWYNYLENRLTKVLFRSDSRLPPAEKVIPSCAKSSAVFGTELAHWLFQTHLSQVNPRLILSLNSHPHTGNERARSMSEQRRRDRATKSSKIVLSKDETNIPGKDYFKRCLQSVTQRKKTYITKCLVLKSSIIDVAMVKKCSLSTSLSRFSFRIISQRKTSFIGTLQLAIFWLAMMAGSKCQTLGWCAKSTKTCTVGRTRGSFLLNGWPQNQFLTAFTPSKVTCKSIFLWKASHYPFLSAI